ncbi:MAG: metal-dependent hydrolase [Candidatus Acidiferrales bacterium]
MEPITHAIASVALSRCGFSKTTRLALPMIVTASLAAELDWLSVFAGPRVFLAAHRTAADSLLGAVVIAAIVAAVFIRVGKRFSRPIRFLPAFLACLAGASLHLLLDLTNSYGVKLLWPLSGKWFALDLASPFDPWIVLILLAGLLLPALFRLITEEIGAKAKRRTFDRGAAVALALVGIYFAGRFVLQERATAQLESRLYRGEAPIQVAAFPQSMSPLFWTGVVETDDTLDELEISLSPGGNFDPESARIFYKPEPSEALEMARRTDTAIAFLEFARFPLARVERDADGYLVVMRDLRFDREEGEQNGIVAVIAVNDKNEVTHEELRFGTGQE